MTRKLRPLLSHLVLVLLGYVMIYPLIWLVFSSFKTNQEIFGSISLFPSTYIFSSYAQGWAGTGQFGFDLYFVNSLRMVLPTVLGTILSSVVVAYGFSRFDFPLRKLLFALMLSTMMLPNAVTIIPSYLLFKKFGWLDSYLPFIIPSSLAISAFFIFMLIQFFRGLPRELDESAKLDGCNSFSILVRILLPLSGPALFSVGIFQFIWTWNDFFNSIIYINSARNFTVSLGLRLAIDQSSATSWNAILAMSVVSIIPCVLLFFFAQRYFVQGIATTGLKG